MKKFQKWKHNYLFCKVEFANLPGLRPIYSAAIYQLHNHLAIGAMDDFSWDIYIPIIT